MTIKIFMFWISKVYIRKKVKVYTFIMDSGKSLKFNMFFCFNATSRSDACNTY